MIVYYCCIGLLFVPELLYVIGLPFRVSRGWWRKLVEDSDGDPHHVDGFYLISLLAALWLFRIGGVAALQSIFFHTHTVDVAITCFSAATVVLAGKIFGPKPGPKNV